MSPEPDSVSIAIDTGGTFTDVVGACRGRLYLAKVPSTPADPATAVLHGIGELLDAIVRAERSSARPAHVIVHGSTVATNALLERRGARVKLITNAGFEDVLEIARQNRPQLYALVGRRPPPLVPAADRIGIAGRLGPQGEVIEPLDDAELAALAERMDGAESIAICLLHSYADPDHERRVAAAVAPLGLPVSVSAALLPEHREYERTSTTVVNAYVAPVMNRYLGSLASSSSAGRIRIMGSAGGALPLERARAEPVHTVLSGPAGGVIGALVCAHRHGMNDLLSLDMGGTSTDVSIVPGHPLHTREFAIGGMSVAVPVLDIHTVGAGGGSIARIDPGGALRVGPESAGADPGPICYARGGRDVTVTDANVWLGRLPVAAWRHLLGDRTTAGLDRAAIASPIAALAAQLGSTTEEAAAGIVAVANTAMEGALRVMSVERGYDPIDFVLVPFGGAAGLHAVELAERLGVPRVLVPPAPGVLSAYGMLASPVRRNASRTVLARVRSAAEIDAHELAAPLVADAIAAMVDDGFDAAALALTISIDARYTGQSYELSVPADGWIDAFHTAHQARYGHAHPGEEVELVTLRVEVSAPAEPPPLTPASGSAGPPVAVADEPVWWAGEPITAPRFDRDTLAPEQRIAGPAIVSEYSATLWLPPAWHAQVLDDGALLLQAREVD
jgi:N-methylhydantoinase A